MKSVLFLTVAALLGMSSPAGAADKKIIFIAGRPSHGPAQHEHRAGCLLLAKCLQGFPGVVTEVHSNGWVADEKAFENAAAIVVYSDGGGGHPFLKENHLETIGALMEKGVGLGCIHYAVEPTTEKGNKEFQNWIGGCFETFWSVNPHWDADFTSLPKHAATRGVKPFKTNDEWYYHMRFRDGMKDVTPILTAMPTPQTVHWKEGDKPSTHGGNPDVYDAVVNKHEPQHVMWVATRADGGRGFGFTGGHFHMNWGNNDQRKLVLNSILWIAKVEVPASGVESSVTQDELMANLDPKGQTRPKAPAQKTEEPKKSEK
ncbi:MAG: ThuA domain-containing protein [Verrucomicrobia bacterium]|nr:ThuA domain-containing protein [Verrucomicrobiota bacterium]